MFAKLRVTGKNEETFLPRVLRVLAKQGVHVLAVHQISVHRNLARREIQTKYFVRQRKIIFHRIALWISVVLHTASP